MSMVPFASSPSPFMLVDGRDLFLFLVIRINTATNRVTLMNDNPRTPPRIAGVIIQSACEIWHNISITIVE